jgi:hypothetical protein
MVPSNIIHFLPTMDSPVKMIYGCILVLIIVYSSVIPLEYKRFADSPLGRIFGIAIVYGVIQQLGWIYGILTAMAFLLLLHGGIQVREGFGDMVKKTTSNKWYVERILGKPDEVIIEQVVTNAPGGN